MYRLARIAPLALTLTLICAAPAFAAQNAYYVQGTGDSAIASCQPYTGLTGFFRCDTVRAAVAAANANVNSAEEIDVIYLQAAGDHTVGQQLSISDRVAIIGRGPRTTTVRGSGTARVFSIASGGSACHDRTPPDSSRSRTHVRCSRRFALRSAGRRPIALVGRPASSA